MGTDRRARLICDRKIMDGEASLRKPGHGREINAGSSRSDGWAWDGKDKVDQAAHEAQEGGRQAINRAWRPRLPLGAKLFLTRQP